MACGVRGIPYHTIFGICLMFLDGFSSSDLITGCTRQCRRLSPHATAMYGYANGINSVVPDNVKRKTVRSGGNGRSNAFQQLNYCKHHSLAYVRFICWLVAFNPALSFSLHSRGKLKIQRTMSKPPCWWHVTSTTSEAHRIYMFPHLIENTSIAGFSNYLS